MQITSDNFNELFKQSFKTIKSCGQWVSPRGKPCKEIICPQLVLTNPKNCLITLSERKLNYAYAIIEKFMYLSQRSDVRTILAYNANMKNYLNPKDNQFDGSYGLRIRKGNQLNWCYEKLKEDPDTRQAVITIHDYTDCRTTLDPACTLSLQFLIRNGELNMICNMRSNDLLWGTCLDVQAFCFIQEVMAFWLGIPVGSYFHQPASLHYYQEFEERIETICNSSQINEEVLPLWNVSYDDTAIALRSFWDLEEHIRDGKTITETNIELKDYINRLKLYWENKRV